MSWRDSSSYFLRMLEGYRRNRRAYIFSDIIPPQDFSGSRNAQNVRHLLGFRSRQFAAGHGQPVIALSAFGFRGPIDLLDQLSLEERLDGAIQGSRPKAKTSASLLLDLPHDCISVQFAGGQGKHYLERNGRQRIKFSFRHSPSMIDISMNDCKPDPLDMSTDPQSCPIMHPTG